MAVTLIFKQCEKARQPCYRLSRKKIIANANLLTWLARE